ncbi:histone transcription regulator 1 [Amanita rubescens]|nr:histone transcription regulator 1 [Amanita rubescens]
MVHFTKPAWVIHKDPSKSDQNAKRLSIFSVHVHPDGSRIATGGLDSKIRIWSTKPILNRSSDLSGKPPKSLCTLHMHTGPVLTVRWAHSGRWLASGSDDAIVMIWDLDPNARGKVWGSDEVNVEGWKPLKRLPGHDSDVTDVAWSPGDRYLASVGLDSTVIIWCGFTLERIVRLNQHQGFVKGVCWDPVGEFLATQSDDRTVKIWRTTDWSLEKTVSKPFEASPGSTFFRRLSWSPDGAHITASNATNNNGYVFIAAVITRNSWTSDISLVGHENTVEVAAYNPHIFLRNLTEPVATYNICSVVALGADDRSVSVWQTKSARPLIVAKEVFDRQIMDLSWSWDGMTLYAASSDGTIAVFNFDPAELEGIAPHSVQQQYLTKFGFTPPPLPEGFSHVPTRSPTQMTPPPSPTRANGQASAASHTTTSTSFPTTNGGERVNVLIAKRGNKKRAALSQVPVNGRLDTSSSLAGPSASAPPSKRVQLTHHRDIQRFPSPSEQPFNAPDSWSRHADVAMDVDVPIDALDAAPSRTKGRRTAIGDLLDDTKPPKARTLGGDRRREVVEVKQIGMVVPAHSMAAEVQRTMVLPVPPLLTYLSSEVDGTDDVLEAENAKDVAGTNDVSFTSGKQTQWLDYVPSPVLSLKATSFLCAVAMQDGSVNVYSHTGRRLMPTMSLDSPCSFIDGNKHSLLVITSSGQLYSWNMKKQTVYFPPVSVLPLLASSPNHTITSASAYSYDSSLSTWVKISERWWADSDAWQGRQRATNTTTNRGVMSMVEGSVNGSPPPDDTPADRKRPEWWNAALTLGHLETKLHATRLLDSSQEYKQALLLYARRIADEGFRAKGEELIKELFGPMYWRPGREEGWTPTVAGTSKRDLLREVLAVFARSKTLTKLALDWQEVLKKAAIDEP